MSKKSFEGHRTPLLGKYFPLELPDGYYCKPVDHKQLRQFLEKHFHKVFGSERDSNLYYRLASHRREKVKRVSLQYFHVHHEHFLFYSPTEKPVGWMTGKSEDMFTFYMRNTGILPRHQGKQLYSSFLKTFCQYVQSIGYERISSQYHPHNNRIFIPKLRRGFMITGIENHENWGSLVKLVKIFHKDRERFFKDKFT